MRIVLVSSLLIPVGALQGAVINIAFHNGGTTVAAMTTRPEGPVVATSVDTWNNPARNGTGGLGLSFSGFALSDASGSATGATLAATSGFTTFNDNGWGTQNQDWVMMEGWYGFVGTESITIDNLPAAFTANGYSVTIFGDVAAGRTMDYTIDGTTRTIIDDGSLFNGTFSPENSTTFSGLNAASFTITGNAAGARSAVNGIIIESIPEASGLLFLAASLPLLGRRRRG